MKALKIFLGIAFVWLNFPSPVHSQWVQTNGPYGGNVRCLAVSGTNLFAGTYVGGVFLSTNNGTSWTAVNSGLPSSSSVNAIAVSPNGTGGTNLFAGTYVVVVFLSTNNGTSWSAASTGLTTSYVYALAVSGTNLFAGTGGGVWRRPLSEMTSVKISSVEMPKEFRLEQNYPNPFNPSTKIRFTLPVAGFTTLKVFDALGREVRTPVSEELKPGSYETTFDATVDASGMYIYELRSGALLQTKKLLLLR